MRDELGILLMEEASGEVAVQLFAELKGVEVAYGNLAGSPGDSIRRATLILLKWGESGSKEVVVKSKMLPVVVSIEDRPDGYVLGEGPRIFSKE